MVEGALGHMTHNPLSCMLRFKKARPSLTEEYI